jgi:hypothetical protein
MTACSRRRAASKNPARAYTPPARKPARPLPGIHPRWRCDRRPPAQHSSTQLLLPPSSQHSAPACHPRQKQSRSLCSTRNPSTPFPWPHCPIATSRLPSPPTDRPSGFRIVRSDQGARPLGSIWLKCFGLWWDFAGGSSGEEERRHSL